MRSRCYRLVTATTKATSRASIATAVSTVTPFLGTTVSHQASSDGLLNDRPDRLIEPNRYVRLVRPDARATQPRRGSMTP
jgi:hypothetical protein